MSPAGKTKNVANYLRAAYFQDPEWIPCNVAVMPATWKKHRERLEEIVLQHPSFFPGYRKGGRDFDTFDSPLYSQGEFVDNWGCTWKNIAAGLDSVIVRSPLEDWEAVNTYEPPDPLIQDAWGRELYWGEITQEFRKTKEEGGLAGAGLVHGFMYMQLWYLRGFENFMMDIGTDESRLAHLISIVLDYNMQQIDKYLQAGAEFMYFGDDLGLQNSLPMSPEKFRAYLQPCYAQMFGLCRDKGAGVYLHSDGHIVEIIPDLIETGVTIINPQIRANTLAELERVAKGKVCIDLDLDRQLFPFATPEELKAHIREAVGRLNSQEGGLMLHAECAPDVPLENIEAICETLEEIGGPSR